MDKDFDIVVVGGGHAGCEAALAAARLGISTALVTLRRDKIAEMSCNPAIGGLAKGHLVKEIDALGGEMGRITDLAMLQFRMLNRGKGPAVWSPRAQSDRKWYSLFMQEALKNQEHLEIVEGQATEVVANNGHLEGARLEDGRFLACRAAVLACGTFLNGLIHRGSESYPAGRFGEGPALGLTESMKSLGFEVGRFKTGTPPRLDGSTIDYERLVRQDSEVPQWFSHKTRNGHGENPMGVLMPCYWTQTTIKSHNLIKDNLKLSALFSGRIKGRGPRYCPSIEDKVVRFAERDHHPLTIEPEGRDTNEVYINGLSTSLPAEVQDKILHTIPGLEQVQMNRPGYAIEYDYFPPYQVDITLESRIIPGLYLAGQILGTSGYEEAAAQGLMAGINAVRKLKEQEPVILDRSQAYIGVLIDDLVTKGTEEPYRMFPSRAEWRLILRQDNADLRLMEIGHKVGLIGEESWGRFALKKREVEGILKWLESTMAENYIESLKINKGDRLDRVLRRPEISVEALLSKVDFKSNNIIEELDSGVMEQVEIHVKYQGYIERQAKQVDAFRRMEAHEIPEDFDYRAIRELSMEGREKLARIRPHSLGQASRISGVSHGDLGVLMVYLKRGHVPRGTK
jgi:tRNA uridine 5-carboxymethylaminomethyl modification enzyme